MNCQTNFQNILKVALILLLISFSGCEKWHVQTLVVDDSRKIRIFKENEWEVSQTFMFDIIENGKVTVPLTAFYYHSPEDPTPKFLLVKADQLVGVVFKSEPKKLRIIHDFSSGENWPHRTDTETWQEAHERGKKLFKAFNKVAGGGYRMGDE
jgi:hypothetical protein